MSQELYLLNLEDDELEHFGIGPDDNPPGRGSGRYPKGSGKHPYQHDDFIKEIENLKSQGLTEKEIQQTFYDKYHMNSSEFRAARSVAIAQYKKNMALQAKEYAEMVDDDGKRLYSNVEIGKMLGVGESTVRNYLKSDYVGRTTTMLKTMDSLKELCDDEHYIDIGPGSEIGLACSSQKLKHAARVLADTEDYGLYDVYVPQMGTGMNTTVKVLAPPGVPKDVVVKNVLNNPETLIYPKSVELYPPDSTGANVTALGIKPPTSVDSNRIQVRYAEEGGINKDGVIEIRRGLEDLNLGNSSYAQVRIMVDGTHYLKGMCVYADDMPEGKDIIFNTNKHQGTPVMLDDPNAKQVFKNLKSDPDNPFGATITRQIEYKGADGKLYLSPVNIVNEEGSWGGEKGWSKTIASQMLGKQNEGLIKRQLNLSYSDRVSDLDDIMMVDNPVIRKKLLQTFADGCDTAAVHLKAAPFPRQSWNVILPLTTIKDDEIFAPQYENGETVCLVRYPHAGTFEIAQLKVNNNNPEGRSVIGTGSVDAVGITKKVADRLSGADFDGDTVMVVPANSSSSNVRINVGLPLKGLEDFDPKELYPYYEGMKVLEKSRVQNEMGKISNLITDMNLKGANDDELARAVRHSMVIIDANKHKLDYIRSYEDNNIEELKQIYQKKPDGGYGGASTLLSKAKSEVRVNERKEGDYITDPKTGEKKKYKYHPETGEKLYSETGRTRKDLLVVKEPLLDEKGNYILNENGKKQYKKVPVLDENGRKQYIDTGKPAQKKSTLMAETKDARKLSSGTVVEEIYADYANRLKGLANEARKLYLVTGQIKYSPEAHRVYKEQVDSLSNKLLIALKNAPKERKAQILANAKYKQIKEDNPNLNDDEKKKYKNQALSGARQQVGAKKSQFGKGLEITDKEWEAIKAGALSNHFLEQIVDNSDLDYLKKLSMPKDYGVTLSDAKVAMIKSMSNSGFSISEIAERIGASNSTIAKYMKGND